jgi:hypothetical protein
MKGHRDVFEWVTLYLTILRARLKKSPKRRSRSSDSGSRSPEVSLPSQDRDGRSSLGLSERVPEVDR